MICETLRVSFFSVYSFLLFQVFGRRLLEFVMIVRGLLFLFLWFFLLFILSIEIICDTKCYFIWNCTRNVGWIASLYISIDNNHVAFFSTLYGFHRLWENFITSEWQTLKNVLMLFNNNIMHHLDLIIIITQSLHLWHQQLPNLLCFWLGDHQSHVFIKIIFSVLNVM